MRLWNRSPLVSCVCILSLQQDFQLRPGTRLSVPFLWCFPSFWLSGELGRGRWLTMFAHWARKKGNHKMSAFYVFPFPALRVTRPPLTLELRKTLRMSLGSRQEYHVPRAQRFVGSMFCLDPEKARPWSLHYTQHYYVSRSLFFLE